MTPPNKKHPFSVKEDPNWDSKEVNEVIVTKEMYTL